MASNAHSPLELLSGSMASGAGGFPASEDTASDFDDTGSDTSLFAAGVPLMTAAGSIVLTSICWW